MTETVKHTPGPWFLEVTERNLWVGVEKAVGGKVGEVITRLDYGYDYNPWHNDMALANARLIAAAPDMLEALKAAIANSDANIGPYGRTPEAQAVYDQVSDAIDKAEGRSHG